MVNVRVCGRALCTRADGNTMGKVCVCSLNLMAKNYLYIDATEKLREDLIASTASCLMVRTSATARYVHAM